MKLTSEQLKLVVLIVISVGFGGYFYWTKLYSPLVKEIKVKEEELATKRGELERFKHIPEELKRERADLEAKRLELESVEGMLPKEKEIPELLESITTRAIANGIDFVSFTPHSIRPGEIYSEVPIDISLNANYHDLGRFLNEIGNLHRIVVPSIKDLSGKEPTKEDPYTLRVSMTISTFVYGQAGGN